MCIHQSAIIMGAFGFLWRWFVLFLSLCDVYWLCAICILFHSNKNMRSETSLHAALKSWYATPDGVQEAWIDGYWIDVQIADLLIEIQTRRFDVIQEKLLRLLENYQIRLVHPIAAEKWIVHLLKDSESAVNRRKSPRRGRWEHIFLELVRAPSLLAHPNFSLEILLIREEEIRQDDGRGSWRRRGVSIIDRRLIEILERKLIASPSDLRQFLPPDLESPFTNQQLANQLGINRSLAAKISYCMRSLNLLQTVGKRRNAILYSILE